MKEHMTFAEKDLANLLHALQAKLAPLEIDPQKPHDFLLLITSKAIGHGNEDLGRILMNFFLKSLSSVPKKPKTVVLLNDAIQMVCDNSQSLGSFTVLVEQGIKILVDGTSVDYFQLENKVKVGQVVSMLAICTEIMNAEGVMTL